MVGPVDSNCGGELEGTLSRTNGELGRRGSDKEFEFCLNLFMFIQSSDMHV